MYLLCLRLSSCTSQSELFLCIVLEGKKNIYVLKHSKEGQMGYAKLHENLAFAVDFLIC